MSKCVFYDQEWNEAPYCVKHGKYLDNGCGDCKPVTVDDMATGFNLNIDMLKADINDYVRVVHCKDCKYKERERCGLTRYTVREYDYCSYGERKDDECK